MNTTSLSERNTKYVSLVRSHIERLGHATNYQLLEALRLEFPSLSATTVHRVTARLLERGDIQLAPPASDGAMRFDGNIEPHDHFMCNSCGLLRDASLGASIKPLVETEIGGGCSISGSLTVSGVCGACMVKGNDKNGTGRAR